jgi:hypothetical protein
MVALLLGHNNIRLELVGIVAGILALQLLPWWIHAVGKMSSHSFAFQNLFIVIVPIILLFFHEVSKCIHEAK